MLIRMNAQVNIYKALNLAVWEIAVTWQHQDGGGPATGARELLELGPAVDGLVSQSFGAKPREVH